MNVEVNIIVACALLLAVAALAFILGLLLGARYTTEQPAAQAQVQAQPQAPDVHASLRMTVRKILDGFAAIRDMQADLAAGLDHEIRQMWEKTLSSVWQETAQKLLTLGELLRTFATAAEASAAVRGCLRQALMAANYQVKDPLELARKVYVELRIRTRMEEGPPRGTAARPGDTMEIDVGQERTLILVEPPEETAEQRIARQRRVCEILAVLIKAIEDEYNLPWQPPT